MAVEVVAGARQIHRHGDPPHRYFSGIPAWRRVSSDLSSARRPCPQVLQCQPSVAKGVFRPVFGTATLPTSTSVPTQRGEGGLQTGLRHGDLAHRYSRGIQAWRDRHQSHVAPARDIHRAGSPCLQTSQRQISLRGEANWTSPSKRICPTPTLKGISRLDRQGD